MEPSGTADVPVEPKERRKIQFAVPTTAPTQLDPRQVEMIRRRRPTPATLFRVADQSSPEDDNSTHQWVVGENGVLKPKRVNPNVYQPPSLRAVQQMAEAQMQKLGVYSYLEDEETTQGEMEEHNTTLNTAQQEGMSTAESQSETGFEGPTPRTDGVVEEEEEEEEEKESTEAESRSAE